jgi:hypothetical protein
LEKLRRTMKNFSQDNHSLDLDLDLGPPKYEAGSLLHATVTFSMSCYVFIRYWGKCDLENIVKAVCNETCIQQKNTCSIAFPMLYK